MVPVGVGLPDIEDLTSVGFYILLVRLIRIDKKV